MDKKKRNIILAVIGGVWGLAVIMLGGYWGVYLPMVQYQLAEDVAETEELSNTQQASEDDMGSGQEDAILTSNETINLNQSVELGEYGIQFRLPGGWNQQEASALDVYYKEPKEQAGFAVFVYKKDGLMEGYTEEEMFELQNEAVLEKRDSVEQVGEVENITLEDIQVMKKTYHTSTDGNNNIYYLYWISFRDNADLYAWVAINGVSEYMEKNENLMDEIAFSARWTGEEE